MGTRRRFGTVRQSRSGRYQARYFDAAGVRHTAPVTFARKGDADAWLASVQTDLRQGGLDRPCARPEYVRRVGRRLAADDRRPPALDPSPGRQLTPHPDPAHLRRRPHRPDRPPRRAGVGRRVVGGGPVPRHRGQGRADHGQGHEDRGRQLGDPVQPVRRCAAAPHRARGDALPRPRRSGHAGRQHRSATPPWCGSAPTAGCGRASCSGCRACRIDPLRRLVDVAETLVEVRGVHHFGPPRTRAARRQVPIPALVVDHLTEHVGGFGLRGEDLVFPRPPADRCACPCGAGGSGIPPSGYPGWRRCGFTICDARRSRSGSPPGSPRSASPGGPGTPRSSPSRTATATCCRGPRKPLTKSSTPWREPVGLGRD